MRGRLPRTWDDRGGSNVNRGLGCSRSRRVAAWRLYRDTTKRVCVTHKTPFMPSAAAGGVSRHASGYGQTQSRYSQRHEILRTRLSPASADEAFALPRAVRARDERTDRKSVV